MSNRFGIVTDNYVLSLANREQWVKIENRKYGNINTFKHRPLVSKRNKENKLITIKDIHEIDYGKDYVANRYVLNEILNIEEYVSILFNNYVICRVDIKRDRKHPDVSPDDYKSIIRKLRSNIRFNLLLNEIVAGWFYRIENDNHGYHVHWTFFLDGNRYCDDNRIITYLTDLKNLSNSIAGVIYLSNSIAGVISRSKGDLRYCNLNICDLSDDDGIIVINYSDIEKRNYARYWGGYGAKNRKRDITKVNIGKSFGSAIFDNRRGTLLEDTPWYKNLDRLLNKKDDKIFGLFNDMDYDRNRLEFLFDFEDSISKLTNSYVIIPFCITENTSYPISPKVFLEWIKSMTNKKRHNRLFTDKYIVHCFSFDNCNDKWMFNLSLVFKSMTKDEITRIFRSVAGWFYNDNSNLALAKIDCAVNNEKYMPIIVSDVNDVKERNKARLHLTRLSIISPRSREYMLENKYQRLSGTSRLPDKLD